MPVLYKSTIVSSKPSGAGPNKGGGGGGGGGSGIVTRFLDSMVRADASTLGKNWVQTPFRLAGGSTNKSDWDAVISSNTATFRGVGSINPAQSNMYCWFALPTWTGLYSEAQKIMQFRYRGNTAALSGGFGMQFNKELLNGIGINIADFYYIGFAGTIIRRTGAGDTTLDATAWTIADNDILKFTINVTGSTVEIKAYKNDTLTLSATDSAASRLQIGLPCIVGELQSGTPPNNNFKIDTFQNEKGLVIT